MKLIVREMNYSLVDFYDEVAREMGHSNTDTLQYDCRKICIAKNIQDGFYAFYDNAASEMYPTMSDADITTQTSILLLLAGPKVDANLKANEVEVFDGFICQ